VTVAGSTALGALDLLPDAVLLVRADGVVGYCNAMAARLLRTAVASVVGRAAGDAVPLLDAVGRDWWAVARPLDADPRLLPRIPMTDLALRTADGALRPVTLTAARLADERGRLASLVLCLRRAERRQLLDAARSELVSTVSHEIRSPLTSIRGFTKTLLAKWERFSDEQRRHMLLAVNEDADRVTRLLGELLDVSRIDAGRLPLQRQMVDVAVVAGRVLERVARLPERFGGGDVDRRLLTSVVDATPRVYADPDKLEQIFTNLVENALQYSSGKVWIAVEATEHDVCCTVADEGPGIPAAAQPLIFTKFFRRAGERRSGTGLGLYITKGLVEAHGGRIWVDSPPGQGASFSFTLPRGAPELSSLGIVPPQQDRDARP
jgi:signal transduction histidine kinase